MTYYHVKNCNIITSDGSNDKNELFFCTENGSSQIISENEIKEKPRVIDGDGRLLLPAFTDIGGNFFDPKKPARDTLQTASAALSAGGYRRIYTFSDAHDHNDARVKSIATMPKKLENIENNGIYYGFHDKNRNLMEIFSEMAEKNALYISAGIDECDLHGVYSSGVASKWMSVNGITLFDECAVLAQELLAAYETGCRIHIRSIASAEALNMIKEAKKAGTKVTCGVSPVHLALFDMDALYYAQMVKLLPPLRSKKDREALREGVFDGSIDCISSLHTPLTKKEKDLPPSSAPFGVSSIETVLPILITYMPELLTEKPQRISEVMSEKPSEIMGENFTLKIGSSADFVLVDPDTELVVTENTLMSKSVNTPFLGHTLMSSLRLYLDGYAM